MSKKKKTISTEEFDRIFDDGKEDITPYLNLDSLRHPGHEMQRVNVDFPGWMVAQLDKQAKHFGVPRQSLIKLWIAERLEK